MHISGQRSDMWWLVQIYNIDIVQIYKMDTQIGVLRSVNNIFKTYMQHISIQIQIQFNILFFLL